MKVLLRTHGGLGNQIFQVLFARLLAELHSAPLSELHDLRYKHRFPRAAQLALAQATTSLIQRFLSALRIPKVLMRLGLSKAESVTIFGTVYLDGYFQRADQYEQFSQERIRKHIEVLRQELQIETGRRKGVLVHLRLGDFFDSRQSALVHLMTRLEALPEGASVMTNDESLLSEPEPSRLMASKNASLVSTENFEAVEVLRLMSAFETISANDSTLTFWASVLGKSKVELKSHVLAQTRALFSA